MEMQIALTRWFDRFPPLQLAWPEDELEWMSERLLSGFRTVPVTR
ncbi:hypothetical protein [Streptomyces sp. NPDC013187]